MAKLSRKSLPRGSGRKPPSRERATGDKNGGRAPIRPPPPGEGKRGEAGYFGYLLRQAHAAHRLAMERTLADLGVTPPQFVVLTMLKAYPGLSGADLARVAVQTPQTIGVIMRNLERDGAIRKTPHPLHGRVLQWTLTRRGLALLEKCRRRVIALERRLAQGLSAGAQATIRRWLAKIAANPPELGQA
ncbi:MarR family transcriptional regulator [Bradyrhizobium sp. NP1]|uniref:MarR family winged helix-turn-helix transcriptional regulator n=1 Tax=Bradyrhizobium sp. NP1 TaxID=3049772 RepID=UPI0025A59FF4|nr:MarR family transcriptional regulator [Bradyrhizobium sp. NP1]WJR75102.1 MarR family transcriptional regulator [Bradyrhizobium sp. NP1]